MQGVDRLAADRAADVDLGVVAVDERVARVGEVGEALAEAVDLGVERLVVGRRVVELDLELVVAGEVHDGPDLDDRVELDVALLLPGGDLDLGRGDRIDVVLDHGVGVVVRDAVLQCLLTRDLGPEARLEDAARRLAGAEPGDAHLASELAERGFDRGLEFGRGDRDVELDAVVFERLDRGLHRPRTLSGGVAKPPISGARGGTLGR